MNRLSKLLLVCALGWLVASIARADTFQLNDGSSITGDILDRDEGGIRLRLSGDTYSDRIPWTRLKQDDLRRLAQDPRNSQLVAPFIEILQDERIQLQGIGELKEPERLSRPTTNSVFGSLFLSPLGWFLLLLMYGANIYAGFEVALYRSQPPVLVCGVSALAPVIGPLVFFGLPARTGRAAPVEYDVPVDNEPAFNPMRSERPVERPSLLHLHRETTGPIAAAEPPAYPPHETFKRGQFTFNRRFFETRFPNFFGVHHGKDKDRVIVVKSLRKEYVTDRIVKVTPGELVLQVTRGNASEEVALPYNDIQELILKHKDDPLGT